jgi:serine/threonine-protein kinase SRPK3
VPVSRVDKAPLGPEAPSYAVIPMNLLTPANKATKPKIQISDFGTSFTMTDEASATLYTPPILLPPEALFNERITLAADVWTLGLTLYEILGERPLFEVWADDTDDIIGEMVSTLGRLPSRWWEKWGKRKEFFLDDGSWNPKFQRIQTPIFRSLQRRLWDMGRGERI